MDPTKLRSRGFNSAADSKRKEAARKDQSLWTETPAERAQRIADEQSGKKRRIENAEDLLTPEEQEAQRRKKKRDQAISKDLEGYHVSSNGNPTCMAHPDVPHSRDSRNHCLTSMLRSKKARRERTMMVNHRQYGIGKACLVLEVGCRIQNQGIAC